MNFPLAPSTTRRCILALLASWGLAACTAPVPWTSTDAGVPDAGASQVQPTAPRCPSPPPRPQCQHTMCLTGAVLQWDGANGEFARICEDPAVTGLIPDCDTGTCYSTFNNFLYDVGTDIYPYLFAVLDTNGDNVVDANDTHCQLNLLGYSWGGVNVLELAWQVKADARIEPSLRVVDRVIMLDAFQPFNPNMEVAREVRQLWSYRHSVPPASGDCSDQAPFGPYVGMAPLCSECSQCTDYDYSLAPRQTFDGLQGEDVGHCDIPSVAHAAVIANLTDATAFSLPPTVPVDPPPP